MNDRQAGWLFASALALLVWIIVVDPGAKKSVDSYRMAGVFPTLSAQNLREISLTSGIYRLLLQRSASGWRTRYLLRGQVIIEDIADATAVARLIEELIALSQARPSRKISSDSWPGYGLGSLAQASGNSIRVHYGNSRHSLHLGTPVADLATAVYARLDEQQRLLIVDSSIKNWLHGIHANPDALRSRRIFHLDAEQMLQRIEWQTARQKLTLFYQRQRWRLQAPDRDNTDPADPQVCRRLLDSLRTMRSQRFIYEDVSTKLTGANRLMVLGYASSERQEYMVIGARHSPEYRYGARAVFKDGQLRLVYYYLLAVDWSKQLPQSTDKFYDAQLLRFSANSVIRVQREGGDNSWIIERRNGQWQLLTPEKQVLPRQYIDKFLQRLTQLKSQRRQRTIAAGAQIFAQFTLHLAATPPQKLQLRCYTLAENLLAVKSNDQASLRLLAADQAQVLATRQYDFYNRRVDAFIFADVERLTVKRPERSYEVYKQGQKWLLARPVTAAVSAEVIADILRHCAWIMAETVLAPASRQNRQRYGCWQSPYRLVVVTRSASNNEVRRTIEIGKTIDSNYCAVWISGFPYIYKIGIALKKILQKDP